MVPGMGVLTRTGLALGLIRADPAAPIPGAGVIPPPRSSSAVVTPREATALDGVFRALHLLQTAAMQLTLDVWRRADLIASPLAASPSVWDTPAGFWAETVASLSARGNAFWRITRDPGGQPVSLDVLDPLSVGVTRDPADPTLRTVKFSYQGRELGRTEIAHLKLLRVPGELLGLGPIQACASTLRGSMDQSRFVSEWWTSGGVPTGVLKTEQSLTADQAKEAKARWTAEIGGGVAVLGRGLDYRPIPLKPEEVQWLASRKLAATEIARMFGVPAHLMLADPGGSTLTYANVAQADASFARWTLTAYMREIESAMTALLPRGQIARFNLDGLLRADTNTRYEAHKLALDAKWLVPDEVRAIEGRPPLPDGLGARPTPATPKTQEASA